MKITNLSLRPDMALAWAKNRKCRTQRVIKPQPDKDVSQLILTGDFWFDRHNELFNTYDSFRGKCPYGQPGDRLRLITTWAVPACYDDRYPRHLPKFLGPEVWSYLSVEECPYSSRKRHGRFMPEWIREIMPQPKILSIRARRIQEITIAECIEEGIPKEPELNDRGTGAIERDYFAALWDSINAKRGYPWENNDWVWDIRFQSKAEMEAE